MNGDQGPFKDEQESRENAQLDDEIIELVDVVRKGDNLPDSDADDLAPLLDQTEGTEEAQPFSEGEGESIEGFSLPLEELAKVDLESSQDERDDVMPDRFEAPDFDFEGPEDFPEQVEESLTGIPEEDLDEVMAGLVDEVEGETSEPATSKEEPPTVSQERLEAIITQTVTEVVERAVRETVAEVAERVINEAIESLKQSLDSTEE